MLKGIAASAGAAVAPLFYLEEPDLSVVKESGLDPVQQHQRYENRPPPRPFGSWTPCTTRPGPPTKTWPRCSTSTA